MEAWVVDEDSKSLTDRALKTVTVNTDAVQAALEELRKVLPEDPEPADGRPRRWQMDQVELTVELTAEGSVKLLGGVSAGATGGITVKFKRLSSG